MKTANFSTRLRHRITIQERNNWQDPTTGEIKLCWESVCKDIPAEVLTGAGKESVQDNAEVGTTAARITVRWMPLDKPEQKRIVWGGLVFNVKTAISDATNRRWLRFECVHGENDGR